MSTFYVAGDGSVSSDRADRQSVAPADLVAAWLAETREIPPQFALGTAQHETDLCVNERYYDTGASGHYTDGVFQLDTGDQLATLMPEKNPLDLADACTIFASRCSGYLGKIKSAVDDYNASNGLAAVDWSNPPSDLWAYLAIAHNQGIGSASSGKGCLGTIARHGLDWATYKANNGDSVNIAMDRGDGVYGDDVISGGKYWDPSFAPPANDPSAPTIDAATNSTLRTIVLLLIAAFVLTRLV